MDAPTATCENLSELGVRRRRTLGFVGAAGAVAWLVGLTGIGAPAAAYLTVGLPAWASALGLLQAQQRTCVRLAAQGVREAPDMHVEPMPAGELAPVREKARKITREAMLIGVAVGILAALIAGFFRGR